MGGSTPSSRLLNYAYLLTVPILSLFEDRTLLSTLKRILEDTGPFICPSSKCTLLFIPPMGIFMRLWELSVWPLAVCMHSLWKDFFNLPCSLLQSHDGPSSSVPTLLLTCLLATFWKVASCNHVFPGMSLLLSKELNNSKFSVHKINRAPSIAERMFWSP